MSFNDEDPSLNDEIDLKEIFGLFWMNKLLILAVTFLSVVVGILYLQIATREYSVKMTYKPTNEESGGVKLGGLGGLASFAGIGLPSNSNSDFDVFIHLMRSEEVAEIVHQNTELVRKVFWSEFDHVSDTFRMPEIGRFGLFKRRVKSIITGQQIEVYSPPSPKRLVPILDSVFSSSIDQNTGFLILSAKVSNPDLVVELMQEAILATDNLIKTRYVGSTSQSLKFYQQKMSLAKSREHREGLAKLIVNEQQKLMLASTGRNFVVEPISRAQVSPHPISPKAKSVLTLSLFIGIFLSVVIVFLRKFVNIRKIYR